MASTSDSTPVNAAVNQLLRDPEGNLEAISETADLFKALATPSRLKMLLVLAHGEATVTHIVESTELSQPLVSQHLKFLRGLHLVGVNRIGR
ncbi:MAG: metalloregulator ArsR/SmtB family transcription factor, partial [Brevibacterium aurantiacum]|nr:metalloregulator ArsR/SmtB family transcription factor [Brevibacterium aurantiacum]